MAVSAPGIYTYRMPAGIPGEVSRGFPYGCTIESQIQNPSTPVPLYGIGVTIGTAGARPIAATDTAIPPYFGLSVRPFPGPDYSSIVPSYSGQSSVGYGPGVPAPVGIIDILRRGFMTVICNAGTPAKGGAVYVWFAASAAPHVQAGIEAVTSASAWQIPGAFFTGAMDAAGNVEIQINI